MLIIRRITEVTALMASCVETRIHPHKHKMPLKARHLREAPLSPKGLIHGEQTQCWRKQHALRRAPVNLHLEPMPGLTLSFAAAIILLDLATQKILGKVGEMK